MLNNDQTTKLRNDIEKQVKDYSSGLFYSYFKYFSNDAKVITSIFNDHKIRFTQPRALNDPLEYYPTMKFFNNPLRYRSFQFNDYLLPSSELFYRVQIIESQINAYGILSLTKVPNSFDMWSRYANGHRGFILEFKDNFLVSPIYEI